MINVERGWGNHVLMQLRKDHYASESVVSIATFDKAC